ncbi:MAG: hypothetical protein IJY10_04635 [Lachnospiraceae bacterium]|nr:hypothetical protein [Lachnospiraceae bacterium]
MKKLKSKKLLACLLAGVMVLSMAACGEKAPTTTDDSVEPSTQESSSVVEESKTPEAPVVEEVSVDFEDGSMSFVKLYTQPANADNSELAVVDYNGSKQLQVKNIDGKVPYVAIDVTSLLGADVAKIAQIEMSITTEYATGNFSSSSGKIYSWVGADLVEVKDDWSVYLKTKNPNKAISKVAAGEEFVADAGNIIIVAMDTDNGTVEGNGNATMYIDNLRFLDASGNLLKADSSVAFVAPDGFESSGKDYSNLWVVTGATNFEGFACSEGAWTQNGFDMTPEFLAALVPGSVIEIEYSSDDGNMWVVFPDSAAGWMRVGDGNNGKAYINNSKNVAQITYEQCAAMLGEDTSTWGARLQCEGSAAWEVYSVKVGSKAPVYALGNPVDFAGFACKEGAWTQNGFEMTPEFLAALVPGSVIEVTYSTEDGSDLWVVFPDSASGWMRVGDGNNGKSVCYNGKAYITYEQCAAMMGEDTSTWGARLQAEGSAAWEVYSVRVGQANTFVANNKQVEFAGFACKEGAWTQNGFDITPEVLAALVPGSVINIQYTSEDGKMWVVFPDSAAGWMRVGDGNNGTAACDGNFCQVTYEQCAAMLGEDTSTWGARLQCEGSSAWEVFSVTVGQQ